MELTGTNWAWGLFAKNTYSFDQLIIGSGMALFSIYIYLYYLQYVLSYVFWVFAVLYSVLSAGTSILGGLSEEVTPDPIPNSVVKLFSADGTAWFFVWESRSPPGSLLKAEATLLRLFSFLDSFLMSLSRSLNALRSSATALRPSGVTQLMWEKQLEGLKTPWDTVHKITSNASEWTSKAGYSFLMP